MALARALDDRPSRLGSPGVPMYGYNVQLLNEVTGEPCGINEKGMLVIEGPLPPGCIQTIWGDDARFVKTYWSLFNRQVMPPSTGESATPRGITLFWAVPMM